MNKLLALVCIVILGACAQERQQLPFLGAPVETNGKKVYPVIRSFAFLNQDSVLVTNKTFDRKIYVADFIFLSCPSICPLMNMNMLHAYKAYEKNQEILFLSHTIDPEHDKIPVLKKYAESINVSSGKWHFVTGEQDSIYSLAETGYFATAYKDSTAPGGYVHSGGLLLIDKNRHVRGVYDGTDSLETRRLINEIALLLKE